jgi:hypothetical protein
MDLLTIAVFLLFFMLFVENATLLEKPLIISVFLVCMLVLLLLPILAAEAIFNFLVILFSIVAVTQLFGRFGLGEGVAFAIAILGLLAFV